MSSRSSGGREKRPEKGNVNSDTKWDVGKFRYDSKHTESASTRARTPRDRSPSHSASHVRPERNHYNPRDSRNSWKQRERDENGVARRKDGERGWGTRQGGKLEIPASKLAQSDGQSLPNHRGSGTTVLSREIFQTDAPKKESTGKSFTDDSRLSKLVRRLTRDDDRDRRITAAKQLKEFLQQPENNKAIIKVADNLLVSLQDVFYERTYKDVKQEVALCIGTLGSVMGAEAQRYVQWLFAKMTAASTDEAKVLFLSALLETLRADRNKGNMGDYMTLIIINSQSVLENADVPELLIAVVDIILYITKSSPAVFRSHFKDTVDILVGWHIDSTQKESLTQYTSDALISFHQFWTADMNFSVTLLGQFLEDMEAYAEDLSLALRGPPSQDEDLPTPEECVTKIAALLRVFTTVVKGLGDYFTPDRGPPLTWEYITETMERIVKCVESSTRNLYSEKVLHSANLCLALLVVNVGSHTAKCCETLLPFIVSQVQATRTYTYTSLRSLLTFIHKVVEQVNTQLPVVFIAQLMASDSLFHKLRFCHSDEVLTNLMTVIHSIMGLKSVPLLEDAYRFVLGDLEIAYNTLLEKASSDHRCHLVADNPFQEQTYTAKQAEVAAIFDICALAEIGNTKNNLIGMWALSPSIFHLLTKYLDPRQTAIMEMYPSVQYALVKALYSHCSRHGHFVSSSLLITQNTVLEGTVLANVSPATSAHFTTVLALLTELLSMKNAPYDGRCLCLKWTMDVIETLQTSQHIYRAAEFLDVMDALIILGYDSEVEVSVGAGQCLQAILRNTNTHSDEVLKRCLDLCCMRLAGTHSKRRDCYLELMKIIPLDKTMAAHNGNLSKSPKRRKGTSGTASLHTVWQAMRNHKLKIPTATFHSHNFRSIMGYILHDLPPNKLGNVNWLEKIFHTCQRLNKEQELRDDVPNLLHLCDSNQALQWFWCTWEAAQFCVLAKLRTPLGKPQDTFTTIEATLKSYAAEVRGKDWDDLKPKLSPEDHKDGGSPCYSSQLRVTLLLQFLEHLEKLLYNAYEGCAVPMVPAPKAVRTFFRTNRATCEEWLLRVRMSVIQISLHCGQPCMAVRQASELLKDMKDSHNTQCGEFDRVLTYLVQALCQVRCADAIQGLYTWCKEALGKRMSWIKAAAEMANGKYEQAAVDFKAALRNYINTSIELEELKEQERSPSLSPSQSPKLSSSSDGHQKWSILSKRDVDTSLDTVVAGFMVQQVCDSYQRLGSWEDVLSWQDTIQQYRQEQNGGALQKALYTDIDINYVKALSSFEEQDFHGVRENLELVPGASLNDINRNVAASLDIAWDPSNILQAGEKEFIRGTTLSQIKDWRAELDSIVKCLDQSQKLCEGMLRVGSLDWPPHFHSEALVHLCCSAAWQNELTNKKIKTWCIPSGEELKFEPADHEVGAANQVLRLLTLQTQTQGIMGLDKPTDFSGLLFKFRLATARLARKQNNFNLAEKLLVKEAASCLALQPENGKISNADSILAALVSVHANNGAVDQLKLMKMEREGAKLLHSKGQHREAIDTLSSSIVAHSTISAGSCLHNKEALSMCSELNARSLVSLVQWLQVDYKTLNQLLSQVKLGQGDDSGVTHTVSNVKLLLDLEKTGAEQKKGVSLEDGEEEMNIGDNPILSDSEAVIGRLIHLSTMQCPSLAKAWYSLAGWCYKWGRKAVDSASHGSVDLSTDEKAQVLELLPKGTSNEETESVLTILSQIHAGITSEEDISDQDQSLYDDGTETTRKQLLASCLSLQIASDECVDKLLDVWKGVVRRVYHYYQLSAKAYFTYLKLNGQGGEAETNMEGNITATLRVLRLLVKHAWELRGVLEDGLAHTPTTPWKGIIPQLFSRLNHPESYVRQSVSDLLCRVAQDAPHLIVYPAVVGCSTNKTNNRDTNRDGLLNEYLSQTEDDHLDEDGEEASSAPEEEDGAPVEDSMNTMLQNCFTAIVDTLSHQDPQMIWEVQLLVAELRRITLLWDELWLGTFNQQQQDVMRRIQQLEKEMKKVMNNTSLAKEEKLAIIREKHNTVLKPTLYTMDQLREITSQPPQTPHEQWFQETYGKLIEEAVAKLKHPSNPSSPHTSWQLFKQIHHALQQRSQKRSSLLLDMEEISSKLANMKNTVIAMPGLSAMGQLVTIESIHNTVQILPTKTKPKKLVFIGSDGKRYPYLFKGLEDLHLDERIMQFLSIVNNMFAKTNKGDRNLYHARHYSVTPLGARSGLIQWVEGATPLFSLYKRWQQREAMAQALKNQQAGGAPTSSHPTTIPRPSEVYYSKLTPMLKEKGLANMDSRKEWPMSVMRKVLEELMSETPKDLLARELWCSSTGPWEWWQVTQTYARSTAVMSMIGYIIGLGDRHLDNVLVDLATGEVVHIDYNVCFEKGKGLRVPEKVPFRMTQNIETALGLTGVEGIFRISCEHVIKTMRKGRETLLTLLEAFVYDPLVDWTTGNEGGYTGAFYGGGQTTTSVEGWQSKEEMERDITLSMFSIRIAEMKSAWFKNKEDMVASLPKLQESVHSHLKAVKELCSSQDFVQTLRDERTYLEESRVDSQHAIYTLQHRYNEFAVVKTTKVEVLQAVQEKLSECEHWTKAHQVAIQTVQSAKLQKMCAEVTAPLNTGGHSFNTVVEFLQGAGQAQMVAQCEQVEGDLLAVLHQRRSVLRACLDVLHTYATIVGQFPPSYLVENRSTRWQHWLQELVCDFTTEKCREIVSDFQDIYSVAATSHTATQTVQATDAKLQNAVTEANTKLVKLLERRHLEGADTSLLTLHVQETTTAIHQFMKENGSSGTVCMTSVVVSALSSLSKRYLVMEGAATAAGDRLMDLTSREGDWFLDELCSMSGNVNQLLGLLNDSPLTQLLQVDTSPHIVRAMQSLHAVYLALQELNINFRNIILPEAVKTMQTQDPSVEVSLSQLDQIVSEAGRPLETIQSQLELQLLNAIMGLDQTDPEVVTIVRKMQVKFEELLQGPDPENTELSPGQMLLMGFNGLFTRLDGDFSDMLEAIGKVQVPDIWRKVDIVKEAKSLQITAFNDSTLGLLANLFFVRRMRAIQEFFSLCKQAVVSVQGLEGGSCPDDEQLAKPIRQFIAEYVRKQVIGLPSQTLGYVLCLYINALHVDVTAEIELKDIGAESKVALEDLCKKAVDFSLKNGAFQHVQLTQASALIGANDVAWRQLDLAKRLDTNISLLKASVQRTQLQLARYQWLHEDILTKAGRTHNQMVMPARATVMSELRKSVQALMSQETAVTNIQERHLQLESSITQRLKWAAGANPSLNQNLQQFEEALVTNSSLIEAEGRLATEVTSICNAVLHFEALRTRTPEAVAADTNFLTLLNRCQESCLLADTCSSSVSEVEEHLMDTKPLQPGQSVNEEWIGAVLEQVNKEISAINSKLGKLRSSTEATREGVKGQVSNIRSILATHHKLMSDIRTILKSMAKQEEQDYGMDPVKGGIREYVSMYKTFSENFTTMLKLVMTDDINQDVMKQIEEMIDMLKKQILIIYDGLVSYAPPLMTGKENEEGDGLQISFASALKKQVDLNLPAVLPPKKPLLIQKPEMLTGTPPAGTSSPQAGPARLGTPTVRKPDKVTRDPRTGKAIQERNSYAVSVWRRVKLKLDGRDPDMNKRFSIAEQVDYVIKEATNMDNLAVLYEGWTPWV